MSREYSDDAEASKKALEEFLKWYPILVSTPSLSADGKISMETELISTKKAQTYLSWYWDSDRTFIKQDLSKFKRKGITHGVVKEDVDDTSIGDTQAEFYDVTSASDGTDANAHESDSITIDENGATSTGCSDQNEDGLL